MSREMAVVTLEIVSPSSKSDGVFPMLLELVAWSWLLISGSG